MSDFNKDGTIKASNPRNPNGQPKDGPNYSVQEMADAQARANSEAATHGATHKKYQDADWRARQKGTQGQIPVPSTETGPMTPGQQEAANMTPEQKAANDKAATKAASVADVNNGKVR